VVQIGRGLHGRLRQVLLFTVILGILIRLALPYYLLSLINHQLEKPGSIHGHVDGLSLGLIRGVYDFEHIHLTSHNPDTGRQDQLLDVDLLKTAVNWGPLVSGRFEGSLDLSGVVLHLGAPAKEVAKEKAKPWTDDDWRRVLSDMVRVRIASIAVSHAQIAYDDVTRQIHTSISTIDGRIDDLIVPAGSDRPARFTFTGVTPGNGSLQIAGTARAATDKPHLEMKASVEQVDLPALSPITEHFDGLVFLAGTFSGYLDAILDGQHLAGTFKPIFRHLEVTSLQKKTGSTATKLFWSLVVPVAHFVLKNDDKDQHAAIIPIDGIIDDPRTDVWTIVETALSNAFIKALIPGFDGLMPERWSTATITPP
jgi:hypothetical protein